MIILSREHIVL